MDEPFGHAKHDPKRLSSVLGKKKIYLFQNIGYYIERDYVGNIKRDEEDE